MQLEDVTSTPLVHLAPRSSESHKGNYGRVLVIGGSRGMAGAPSLAGKAALRSGAGLVTLAVPRSIQAIVSGFEASYMTVGLGCEADDALQAAQHEDIQTAAAGMTALALGPGLGLAETTVRLVHSLYESIEQPLVADADALNALAKEAARIDSPGGPRILTPHPKEFQRLCRNSVATDPAGRAAQAAELCLRDTSGKTIVVLKGHGTIITDGRRYSVNTTGNPGMATGGTGDCLTGVVTALLAQGLAPWEAARLGVYVHGLAGDLAAKQLGQTSLIASDLAGYLPTAFQSLE